jgi:hypothetical protein
VKHADRAKKEVNLFNHSNGGSGTVPWRMVNLIREFTEIESDNDFCFASGNAVAVRSNSKKLSRT